MEIEITANGHESTYVHGAVASDLAGFIDPAIPFVWLERHYPHAILEWWNSSVPLNGQGETITASVRLLSYDLMLPTQEFLSRIKSFDEHGLTLTQSTRAIPNSLDLTRVPDQQRDEILIKNGAVLRIYLPHAVETAMIVSYRKGYLAQLDIGANHAKQLSRPVE